MMTKTRLHAARRQASLLLILLAACLPALAATPPRVLVYGDSNTWGWMAVETGFPAQRHPRQDRWPEVARDALGTHAEIVVDALSGRTVDLDHVEAIGLLEPDAFNGQRSLPAAIARELPLALVVIMLGTNDVASDQPHGPERIAEGIARLVRSVHGIEGGVATAYPAPKVLVVVPPPLGDTARTPIGARFDAGSAHASRVLPTATHAALAELDGVSVLDAGEIIPVIEGIDGIHLSAAQQRALGRAVAGRIATELGLAP